MVETKQEDNENDGDDEDWDEAQERGVAVVGREVGTRSQAWMLSAVEMLQVMEEGWRREERAAMETGVTGIYEGGEEVSSTHSVVRKVQWVFPM